MTRIAFRAVARGAMAAAIVVASCAHAAVGPSYRRPDIALTARYMATPAAPVAAPAAAWWEAFGDPLLDRLVERALAENLDIRQAEGRLIQSRAAARSAGAALLPSLQASGAAANEEQSLLSPIGEIGRHLPGYQREVGQYDLGLGASWEIDLFGGRQRQHEEARAQARAGAADLEAARLSIAADVADTYLQIRAYQARLEVARRQEGVEQDLVALVGRRAGQGVASDRELNEARAELEGVASEIPSLTAGLDAQLDRLDVLLGSQAGAWRADLATPTDIPAAPAVSGAEGPPMLLRRRPDVVAAEQRLIAANAQIGAAISDYYPKISIGGLLGLESIDAGALFTGAAAEHQLGAGLRWRLFDFGRVDAEVQRSRGRYAELLAAWRSTVFRATGEVETAFSDLSQAQARAVILGRRIDDLSAARRQARQAYESGATSLVELRDADRDFLSASDQLAQTKAAAARAAVAVFRALGGGWG